MTDRHLPLLVAVVGAIVGLLVMPAEFYAGDATAIKVEAIHWVRSGAVGFDETEKSRIATFLAAAEDQYFKRNADTATFHNRWGPFNLLISALAELPNITEKEKLINGQTTIDGKALLSHNMANILWGGLCTFFLCKCAQLYTRRKVLVVAFAFSAIYCSFIWNYFRAQSYEIIQITLFSGLYYFHARHLRRLKESGTILVGADFVWSHILLGLLCLTKTFFLAIYPWLWLSYLVSSRTRVFSLIGAPLQTWGALVLPPAIVVTVLVTSAQLFYGQLFFGHLHHAPHSGAVAFSSQFIGPRLYDYLISANRSMFVHMPLLIIAAFGWPKFVRDYRAEAVFVGLTFLFSLGFFSLCYTVGDWCYGPRFFTYLLPIACLPSIFVAEWCISRARPTQRIAATVIAGTALLASLTGQWHVNSLPFHHRYHLEAALNRKVDLTPALRSYMENSNYATIARDTNAILDGRRRGYLAVALAGTSDDSAMKLAAIQRYLAGRVQKNFLLPRWHCALNNVEC